MDVGYTEADFMELVKSVLERELSISLTKNGKLTLGHSSSSKIIDLYDSKTNTYVEIKQIFHKDILGTIFESISSITKLAIEKNVEVKINIFIVFNDYLTVNDKLYLEKKLPSDDMLNRIIYDTNDILELAKKHKVDIFNSSNNSKKTNKDSTPKIKNKKIKREEAPQTKGNQKRVKQKFKEEQTSIEDISSNVKGSKVKSTDSDVPVKESPKTAPLSNILDIIKRFSGKFYVISSHLGRHTEISEFHNDLPEEHSSYKKYKAIIESIEPGDIFITNEILQDRKDNKLYAIDKLGVITTNPNHKDSLAIDWKLTRLVMELTTSINYSSSLISRVNSDDLVAILSHIDTKQLDLLFNEKNTQNTITTVTKITSIAGITSDADSGEDLLEISRDVSAFARVIATKSFTPPLAIALFGTWGSGKSFFMRKLKERIQKLSNKSLDSGFCNGIAHVHFNAWSYMDTNLWAGIITKIFEGLNQYISNENNAAATHKKEIEEEIAKQLNITKNEISNLESEILSKNAQLKQLNGKRKNSKNLLKDKIKLIRNKTLDEITKNVEDQFDVTKKITEAIDQNPSLASNKEILENVIPEKYWGHPEALYNESKRTATFLKVFSQPKYLFQNIIWFILILSLVIFLPKGVQRIYTLIGITDYSFAPSFITVLSSAGIIIGRCTRVYKNYQPLVASFWNIKKEYTLKKEEALFNYKQQEKALELEILKIKDELTDITHQINQTEEQKAALVFRKNNTLSTEALKSFIEKRSESTEYKKHLGLVSIIRNDFETLSTLFSEHIDEVDLAKKQNIERLRKHFERPLERIVLYIDDLDRCPEDRVVEVLEAVNLLMAYPLFVVIVGVDPRWVKNALIKKHRLHFTKDDTDSQKELIDASSYLEKIFQVPFNLKAAEDSSVKNMIKTLVQSKPSATPGTSETKDIRTTTDQKTMIKPKEDIVKPSKEIAPPPGKDTISKPTMVRDEIIETNESFEPIEFSEKETELLQEMSIIVGSSPRAIKRFINIYRIVKAHENFEYTNDQDIQEMLVVMFLLALPIGKYKELTRTFFIYITDTNGSALTIKSYFMNNTVNPAKEINTDLQTDLREKIIDSNVGDILNIKGTIFNKHLLFIKRFAFINY